MSFDKHYTNYCGFLSEVSRAPGLFRNYDVQEVLRSECESRSLSSLLSLAFDRAQGEVKPLQGVSVRAYVFGSIGRLDANILTADVDPLLVYEGEADDAKMFDYCTELVRVLIHRNMCLDFPHSPEILAGAHNFREHPLPYPIYSIGKLVDGEDLLDVARRMQLLFEARPIGARYETSDSVYEAVWSRYLGDMEVIDTARLDKELELFYGSFYERFALPFPKGPLTHPVTWKTVLKAALFREAILWVGLMGLACGTLNEGNGGCLVFLRGLRAMPLLLRPTAWLSGSPLPVWAATLTPAALREDWDAAVLEVGIGGWPERVTKEMEAFQRTVGAAPAKNDTRGMLERYVEYSVFSIIKNANTSMFALHQPAYREFLSEQCSDWSSRMGHPEVGELEKTAARTVLYEYMLTNFVAKILARISSMGIGDGGGRLSTALGILGLGERCSQYLRVLQKRQVSV